MTTTLVTTTRNRALCFGLLERWVKAQTVKFDQWLVINDGTEEYRYTLGQEVVKRDPSADTMPSLCHNWLAAIPLVRGERVVVFEDDDYYPPHYLETMLEGLRQGELAGITRDVYYRLPSRQFLTIANNSHASLGATAFRSSLLPFLRGVIDLQKSIFIDQYLWYQPPCERVMLLRQPFEGKYLHVGFKNMPGAGGLGFGHGDELYTDWVSDPDFKKLRELVGEEAASVYASVQC